MIKTIKGKDMVEITTQLQTFLQDNEVAARTVKIDFITLDYGNIIFIIEVDYLELSDIPEDMRPNPNQLVTLINQSSLVEFEKAVNQAVKPNSIYDTLYAFSHNTIYNLAIIIDNE